MRRAITEALAAVQLDVAFVRRPVARNARPIVIDSSRRSICIQCQYRTSFAQLPRDTIRKDSNSRPFLSIQRRNWSSHPLLRRDDKKTFTPSETSKSLDPRVQSFNSPTSPDIPLNGSSVHPVPDENLPSHRERQQWTLTKRFNALMDSLLPRIALVSQRINEYTGTDYTGIESLRHEIKEQEALVKARHGALGGAKAALESARTTQTASQKEVVGLLERKHGWSAADLERYMSLIRSEHLNEQAVQAAKDGVAAAERALEEARTRLEARERAQYHEEQIWSDTIRRNSTWVTIGLMGVNILLLLANVVLLEPWRRRRLVREVKTALEEHKTAILQSKSIPAIEDEIDDAVWPEGIPLESIEEQAVAARTAAVVADAVELEKLSGGISDVENALPQTGPSAKPWIWNVLKSRAADLFSERIIQVRQVDITAVAIEGVAVGAATATLAVYVLLRPR